jgi:hypothetical protein
MATTDKPTKPKQFVLRRKDAANYYRKSPWKPGELDNARAKLAAGAFEKTMGVLTGAGQIWPHLSQGQISSIKTKPPKGTR